MKIRRSTTATVILCAALSSVLLAACAPAQRADSPSSTVVPTTDPTRQWHDDVALLAAADGNTGRRAALQQRLGAIGLHVRSLPFESRNLSGVNLLADISGPADAPLLLIGAHYDKVNVGRGATDNASGSATVLALGERFRRAPLQHHRVAIAFWDLEERGLVGSAAYIANGGTKPALYVNFDVFAWGDTLWMMSPEAEAPLVRTSRDAAAANGIRFVSGEQYPPTDHRAFLKAGWPAVSYSLVGGDEIPLILEEFAGKKPAKTPKVMEVIHHDADTMDQVDAPAAVRGVDALEAALRAWDAAAG
ncbi:MAG TPA: M28 family metallopeptidase [Lysobacter sp.]|nr:M28 family metallopeptidase [Lysobacter sp.]